MCVVSTFRTNMFPNFCVSFHLIMLNIGFMMVWSNKWALCIHFNQSICSIDTCNLFVSLYYLAGEVVVCLEQYCDKWPSIPHTPQLCKLELCKSPLMLLLLFWVRVESSSSTGFVMINVYLYHVGSCVCS